MRRTERSGSALSPCTDHFTWIPTWLNKLLACFCFRLKSIILSTFFCFDLLSSNGLLWKISWLVPFGCSFLIVNQGNIPSLVEYLAHQRILSLQIEKGRLRGDTVFLRNSRESYGNEFRSAYQLFIPRHSLMELRLLSWRWDSTTGGSILIPLPLRLALWNYTTILHNLFLHWSRLAHVLFWILNVGSCSPRLVARVEESSPWLMPVSIFGARLDPAFQTFCYSEQSEIVGFSLLKACLV